MYEVILIEALHDKGNKGDSLACHTLSDRLVVFYGKPLIAISHTNQGLTTTQRQ